MVDFFLPHRIVNVMKCLIVVFCKLYIVLSCVLLNGHKSGCIQLPNKVNEPIVDSLHLHRSLYIPLIMQSGLAEGWGYLSSGTASEHLVSLRSQGTRNRFVNLSLGQWLSESMISFLVQQILKLIASSSNPSSL